MSDQETAAPAGPLGFGAVARLLTSPTQAFRSLAANPQWLGAFLLYVVIIGVATTLRMEQDLTMQYTTTETVMERMGLPDEDIDEALDSLPNPDNLSGGDRAKHLAPAVIVTALFGFLGALVYWLIGKVFGAQGRYGQALSVFWHANLAAALAYLVLAVMVRIADTVEVSIGLGAVVPVEWGSAPHVLLEIINPFSIAMLFLLAVGTREVFRVAGNRSWNIAGTFWGLSVLVQVVFQLIGSWFSGNL